MKTKSNEVVLALALLGLATAGGVRGHEGHQQKARGSKVREDGTLAIASDARASLGLTVVPVEERSFDELLIASGKVVAPWDARAFATARVGGRVTSIAVKPWDRVEKGAVLAEVESAELEDLGLALIQARLRRAFLVETVARERELVTRGVSAGKELVALETELAKADGAEEIARSKLTGVGLPRDEVELRAAEKTPRRLLAVRAPIAGVVVHLDVSVGEVIEPTKHLFEVHDLSRVWVETRVLEPDIGRLRVGQGARVRAGGATGTGRVVHVAQGADELGAVLVYAEVDNRALELKANAPAQVELVVARSEDAVAVPKAAIVAIGIERFVLSEEEPGVYRRRDLVLGKSDDLWVEALEGLYLGDRVVVAGQHELGGAFAGTGELRISAAARKRLGVQDDEVELGAIGETAHVLGRVRVPVGREATATARVPGKIARLVAKPAARVKKGDVLAELESFELETLQLDLAQAQLEVALARKNVERVRGLARQDIEPRAELLRLENELLRQEAGAASLARKLRLVGVTDAEIAAVASARAAIRTLPVRAPIDGVVSAPLAIEGQVVALGAALYHVEDTRTVWVEGAAIASDLDRLKPGQPVRVRLPALPGETIATTLAFVGHGLDEATRTLPIYVLLANEDGRLRAGLQATLDVDVGATDELVSAPQGAVLDESGGQVVILAEGAGYRRVPVELGARRDGRRVEVVRGLFPGDRVVITGAEEVRSALLTVR